MDLSNPVSAVIPTLEGQILRVLARTTRPLTAPNIIRLVNRGSGPGIRVALTRLTDVGTVLGEQVGRQLQYEANRAHAAWPAIEAVVDFANGFARRLDGEISRLLDEAPDGDLVTCAVFGSTARGTADADSDIDLALVVPDDMPQARSDAIANDLTNGIEQFTGNATNVMVLTHAQRDDMVARGDALVGSWHADARTVHGPPLLMPSPGE